MNPRIPPPGEKRETGRAVNPWVLVYDEFDPEQEPLREALCALGNGHFVTRGAAEEAPPMGAGGEDDPTPADDAHYPGTYVAGGYNRLESEVAGRTVENEDLVNFPNWLSLTFRPQDGDWLRLKDVEILSYRQELHLREGLLSRDVRFRDADGRVSRVESRRLVSMNSPHLAAIEYRVTPQNWDGDLVARSELDGAVRNQGVERYRGLADRHLDVVSRGPASDEGVFLVARTSQSRFEVGQAARMRIYRRDDPVRGADRRLLDEDPERIGEETRLTLEAGETVRIEKTVALYSSHDRGIGETGEEARRALSDAGRFEHLLEGHRRAWRALWRRYDIEIGNEEVAERLAGEQLTLRLHVFHVLQTISPHTVGLDVGAPARGLHGEAYRGHIFWDELFVLPFYNLRQPRITRSLLLYRYFRLDAARRLAREAGYSGAMYPWQSSHAGEEATQELHLNPRSGEWDPDRSRLQRHVNAAIVYNLWRYWQATGDEEFLRAYGAEMILEIARFWVSIASWNPERERYEIKGVMGPDEYHEKYPEAEEGGLRNNAYTNVMASWCILRALDVLGEVGKLRRSELVARLRLDDEELHRWRRVARRMYVPFLEDGVIEQFEGYADLEPFDWEGYRKKYGNIERLDRILKAEDDTPDRYQVSKQADATMLFYLFDVPELREIFRTIGYSLDPETISKTIEYYRPRTSHGSTLSKLVYASVIHHLDCEEGCRLFVEALRSDLEDVQGGTTQEGIHLGAMAGTVAIVLRRYLGAELRPDGVRFDPEMPSRLRRIRCRIEWRDRWLDVELSMERLRVTPDRDRSEPVPVRVGGDWRSVAPGSTFEATIR